MCNPLDPTVLHGAECKSCGAYFADGDELNDDGECNDCVEERYDGEGEDMPEDDNPET